MFARNEKISVVQLNLMLIFYLLNTTVLFLPASLAKINNNSVLFMTVFWSIFSVCWGCFLVFWGRKIPQYTAVEWYEMSFGKNIGKVLAIFLGVSLIFYGAMEVRIFAELVLGYMLPKTPLWLVVLVLVIMVGFSGSGGIESNGRLAEILAFFVFVPLFFVLMAVAFSVDFARVLPVYAVGLPELWKGGNEFAAIFQGFVLLLFVFPFLKNDGEKSWTISVSVAIYGLFVCVVALLCVAIYGGELLGEKLFPTLQMLERVSFQGIFLTRQDAIVLWFWFASTVIFSAGMILFANLTKKKVRKDNKDVCRIICVIMFIFALIPRDLATVYEIRRSVIPWLNGLFLLVLPIATAVIYYVKRGEGKVE